MEDIAWVPVSAGGYHVIHPIHIEPKINNIADEKSLLPIRKTMNCEYRTLYIIMFIKKFEWLFLNTLIIKHPKPLSEQRKNTTLFSNQWAEKLMWERF